MKSAGKVSNALNQAPTQALRFSQGRGERLVMNRKGPWEGYRRRARERRLGTRQALNATDREEGVFIQLAFVYGLRYLFKDELSIIFHLM